ncbi:uncharacterized protein [Nicotiana sylvestris]|uniref:uncharacterized protein n=1 Tax=Nicotiana sylvestris TaxID=4096 RepID=UPI00388C8DD0
MGHRPFLESVHRFRLQRVHFNGKIEQREPPIALSGSDILKQMEGINANFGKVPESNAKDLMHIKKNVCENVIYTLLNDTEKSKDNLKARNDLKEMGIKKELWHLLLIAIRSVLPDKVIAVLIELSSFFRQLCVKSLSPLELDKIQSRYFITMNHLEMLFPPKFFTIMVHLTCHLAGEAKLGYLGHFKSYVRNMSQPEGSIAERYLAEEALTFCSQYIEGIETRFNRPLCVDDFPEDRGSANSSSIFPPVGKGLGAVTFEFSPMANRQAYRYVLLNYAQVMPFINEFKAYVRKQWKGRKPSNTEIEKIVSKDFIDWFPRKIVNPDISNTVSDELKFLADGPAPYARSGAAGNLRQEDLPYYGKLEDLIDLNYYRFRVTSFKCKWADTTRNRGFRKDAWRFPSVNFLQLIHIGDCEEHDPYIEASQAQMVYYVDDEVNKGWSTVVHLKLRDLYEMREGENEVPKNEPFPVLELGQFFDDVNDLILSREDEIDEVL